jgi:very-short-patch-repair endonuclease
VTAKRPEATHAWKKERRISPVIRSAARELRHRQTPAEEMLWRRLRGQRLAGCKFRRQHPIGRFIVDFCCPTRNLVIEIDGDGHAHQADYDATRTEWLNERGYRVIRFSNADVCERLEEVLEAILLECQELH